MLWFPLISIHTLRVEGDFFGLTVQYQYDNFNPHPPCGGWHDAASITWSGMQDFNPHPPCGGWHISDFSNDYTVEFQSTPSVWRVTWQCLYLQMALYIDFNPHPPCGGWPAYGVIISSRWDFNPHPPCGGWLPFPSYFAVLSQYFNPHPPCGGWRQVSRKYAHVSGQISIHTLRVEGDSIS